ncbi:large subunit ribosomal protein L9 [Oscillospiraceae bacterium]|nr:large subunit ribosomal protein L9 [Oscillospiraceae bacterium]
MKLILLQDVKNVGKANDVVDVSDGYGRNFLLKNKLAKETSAANMNEVKLKKGAEAEHARRALEEAKATKEKLDDKKFTLKMKCGEGGKLYGAVTDKDIADELKKNGFDITKKQVVIKDPIKNVGTFGVRIKLHPKVSSEIAIEVEAL